MTPSARRVAVTGVGAISALGPDVPRMWSALCDGRSAIARIESVDVSGLRFQNGAEVKDFDPAEHFEAGRLDLLDRFAQFAVVAAREAVRDSGLELTAPLRERTAVFTGSSLGGQTTQDAAFVELYQRKSGRVHPLSIPRGMANAGASQISMEFGLTGPCLRSRPRARPRITRSARRSGWCAAAPWTSPSPGAARRPSRTAT